MFWTAEERKHFWNTQGDVLFGKVTFLDMQKWDPSLPKKREPGKNLRIVWTEKVLQYISKVKKILALKSAAL